MAQVITAKEFVEGVHEQFQVQKISKNKNGKVVASVAIAGKVPLIQFGTSADPITTRNGVVRFDNATQKYLSVDSTDCKWALEDRSGYFEKMTRKLHTELGLRNYNKEGSSDYYAYEAIKLIISKVVDAIVNGVPDGNGGVVKPFRDEAMTEPMVRRMLTTPLEDRTPIAGKDGEFYPPKLKAKVRYFVREENGQTASAKREYSAEQTKNFTLGLEPRIDAADEEGGSARADDPFTVFRKFSEGVWIVQINEIFFKGRTEVNLTMDLKRAKLKCSTYGTGIDYKDDDGASGGAGGVGGFGSGGEPAAKRARVEDAEPEIKE